MSITPAEKLVELIDNFIDYCYHNIETIYGFNNNNEHEPITLPVSIQTTGFIGQEAADLALNFQPLTDAGYYGWDYYYGRMNCIYSISLAYFNGTLNVGEPVFVGKYDVDGHNWENLPAGCEPIMLEIINDYMNGHSSSYIFTKETYPDKPVFVTYYSDWSGTHVRFYQDDNGSPVYNGFKTSFPKANNVLYTANEVNIHFYDFLRVTGDIYTTVDFGLTRGCAGSYMSQVKDAALITNTNNQTFINDYITNNGAEHNYTYTYETENGDEITVYYGDNYVIYKCDDDTQITYDDNYNIINKIKDDTGLPISNPTYKDKKYGPPVTDDDYISMGLGTEENGMAMFNMAVLTRDELVQLIGDFESTADTGLSFIPHCISLFKLGFDSDKLLTTNPDKIYLHKEPGKTAWHSAANTYKIVDKQKWAIDIGAITIDRETLLTNTFYDFSPYTTYELYIPGCGWINLPDIIVGRLISVHIVFDLCTCSCKGVVRIGSTLTPLPSDGTTIATVNGIIGSSVPLSINETGLQRSAILNGATQVATGMGTALVGAGLDNPYMAIGGFMQGASGMANMYVAGNTTYTNTKGGATDYSIFGDGHECVLKITRPVLDIPDNYGHTIGYVCNEYNVLSEFHGFTVCANPHVHIEATSAEKEEIKMLLEQGVILPSGEE